MIKIYLQSNMIKIYLQSNMIKIYLQFNMIKIYLQFNMIKIYLQSNMIKIYLQFNMIYIYMLDFTFNFAPNKYNFDNCYWVWLKRNNSYNLKEQFNLTNIREINQIKHTYTDAGFKW
jgi:hypothetical protein